MIQRAEALWHAKSVLRETFTSTAWQDGLLESAQNAVGQSHVGPELVGRLDVVGSGYPATKTVRDNRGDAVDMPVAPFQYINNHDHSHLIAWTVKRDPCTYAPLADRSRWYAVQPFVVALYTAQGVPMLWQGQELSDNWVLAGDGDLRIHVRRDMHWEYFYDEAGAPLVRLHRSLGRLRASSPALRRGELWSFDEQSRPQAGVVAYGRRADDDLAVVLLNFADVAQEITVPAPASGTYAEEVDACVRDQPLELRATAAGDPLTALVPSHYGYVFRRRAGADPGS